MNVQGRLSPPPQCSFYTPLCDASQLNSGIELGHGFAEPTYPDLPSGACWRGRDCHRMPREHTSPSWFRKFSQKHSPEPCPRNQSLSQVTFLDIYGRSSTAQSEQHILSGLPHKTKAKDFNEHPNDDEAKTTPSVLYWGAPF